MEWNRLPKLFKVGILRLIVGYIIYNDIRKLKSKSEGMCWGLDILFDGLSRYPLTHEGHEGCPFLRCQALQS